MKSAVNSVENFFVSPDQVDEATEQEENLTAAVNAATPTTTTGGDTTGWQTGNQK